MKMLIQATLPYNFVESKNSEILSQAWREKKILCCSSLLVLFIANTINGALGDSELEQQLHWDPGNAG